MHTKTVSTIFLISVVSLLYRSLLSSKLKLIPVWWWRRPPFNSVCCQTAEQIRTTTRSSWIGQRFPQKNVESVSKEWETGARRTRVKWRGFRKLDCHIPTKEFAVSRREKSERYIFDNDLFGKKTCLNKKIYLFYGNYQCFHKKKSFLVNPAYLLFAQISSISLSLPPFPGPSPLLCERGGEERKMYVERKEEMEKANYGAPGERERERPR